METSIFEEMLDNLALKPKENLIIENLVQQDESPLETLIRVFNTEKEMAFLTPVNIPEYFIDEINQGKKTPFITERHFDLMSQYNWDFYFDNIVKAGLTPAEIAINQENENDFREALYNRITIIPAISYGDYF